MLYVSHREKKTSCLGPGLRYVLWVQGCKKRCENCIFPEGQPLNENGSYIDENDIFEEIISVSDIRGVTISGGEPFLQISPLLTLIKKIKKHTNLDIMIYSGYKIDEIKNMGKEAREILKNIDLLIDGEYIENKNFNNAYRGSENQKIHALSKKYRPFLKRMTEAKNRNIEFIVKDDGDVFMVGIPAKKFNENFINSIYK